MIAGIIEHKMLISPYRHGEIANRNQKAAVRVTGYRFKGIFVSIVFVIKFVYIIWIESYKGTREYTGDTNSYF